MSDNRSNSCVVGAEGSPSSTAASEVTPALRKRFSRLKVFGTMKVRESSALEGEGGEGRERFRTRHEEVCFVFFTFLLAP